MRAGPALAVKWLSGPVFVEHLPHVKIPLSYWCVTLSMKKKGLALCVSVCMCLSVPWMCEREKKREKEREKAGEDESLTCFVLLVLKKGRVNDVIY